VVYLLISIFFAAALPICMRISINKGVHIVSVNNMYRITTGVVALGVILFRENPVDFICYIVKSEVFLYGVLAGVLYWLGGYTALKMLNYGNVGISWTIKRLSMILPTLASVFYWHEIPLTGLNSFWGLRGAGILAAVLAIIFFGIDRYHLHSNSLAPEDRMQHVNQWIFWVIAAFLTTGFWEILLRVSRTFTVKDAKFIFISTVFISAMLMSIPGALVFRKHVGRKELCFGLLFGLCSLGSSGLRPWALQYIDGYILFPVTTISVSLLVLLGGYVFWKEKLDKYGFLGIAMTVAAIVLLAIQL
jgi:multidrug transporter EmrE-like cation transporter